MEQMMIQAVPRQILSDPLVDSLVASIQSAKIDTSPFFHLELRNVFPDDVYSAMQGAMPAARHYRPMHGRTRRDMPADSAPTRVKIDLLPEYIRHFAPEARSVWQAVGRTLCSHPVQMAFRRMLAPAMQARFGKDHDRVSLYPIPILTRDIAGYRIPPHTDTHWKGITVQLYLPGDAANTDIGTIFHGVLPDGSRQTVTQMSFAPNSGYGFVVGDDTWHSVATVPDRVRTRDSILLTYFVDQGLLRFVRNRGKRFGNFVLNEFRNRA